MKQSLLTLLAICMTWQLSAQDRVTYKVIKDNPKDVPNAFLNLELLEFEMPVKNFSGFSFCLGGNLYVNYKNKFGAEATYRQGWLNLVGVTRRQVEMGVFYNLRSKVKTKNQKVILSQSSYTSGNTTYTTTKSIDCPASRMKTFGVRAGLYTNQEAFEFDDEALEVLYPDTYRYRWSGLYLGLMTTRQMNYRINTDSYGEAGAGFIRRFYLDVTISPFASLTPKETTSALYTGAIGRLGVRGGVEVMPANRRKKQKSIYIKMEGGYRPMDTYFVMCSMGFNIKRTFKALANEDDADRREME